MRSDTTARMRAQLRPLAGLAILVAACRSAPEKAPSGPFQTEADERLRYELLEPTSHEFRVTYELAATTAGARTYFTPVRGDTFVSEVKALDLFTGAKLDVGLVSGADARKNGHPGADPQGSYFAVRLDRPVPEHGEVRLRLEVKYEDRTSYEFLGSEISFQRLLAVNDVGVTLPAGYALVDCNQPARIEQLADERLSLTYAKFGHAPVPLRIRATKVAWSQPGGTLEVHRDPRDQAAPIAELVCFATARPNDASVAPTPYAVDCDALRTELLEVEPPTIELVQQVAIDRQNMRELVARFRDAPDELEVRARDTGALVKHVLGEDARATVVLEGLPERTSELCVRARKRSSLVWRTRENRVTWCVAACARPTAFLPRGWRVIGCSQPAGLATTADGQQRLEFGPIEDATNWPTVTAARLEPAAKN